MSVSYQDQIEMTKAQTNKRIEETRQLAVEGGLICLGLSIVALFIWSVVAVASDSDMTDALQTCGVITVSVKENQQMSRNTQNDSVDICRRQVFEFFKGNPNG